MGPSNDIATTRKSLRKTLIRPSYYEIQCPYGTEFQPYTLFTYVHTVLCTPEMPNYHLKYTVRIQTLFFQLMPFRDVGDPLAVDKNNNAVTVPSVAGLMKEAIAQCMEPSATSVAVLTISKQFVVLGMPLPARSREGRAHTRRKASSETDGHRGTTKAKARVEEEAHQGRRNRSTRTRRRRTLSH